MAYRVAMAGRKYLKPQLSKKREEWRLSKIQAPTGHRKGRVKKGTDAQGREGARRIVRTAETKETVR